MAQKVYAVYRKAEFGEDSLMFLLNSEEEAEKVVSKMNTSFKNLQGDEVDNMPSPFFVWEEELFNSASDVSKNII